MTTPTPTPLPPKYQSARCRDCGRALVFVEDVGSIIPATDDLFCRPCSEPGCPSAFMRAPEPAIPTWSIATEENTHRHIRGPIISDASLCGLTFGGGPAIGIQDEVASDEPIDCPHCLTLIQFCRNVPSYLLPPPRSPAWRGDDVGGRRRGVPGGGER